METHTAGKTSGSSLRVNQAQARLVRLQILSTNQAQRLSDETSTARDARLEQEHSILISHPQKGIGVHK